MDGNGRWAKKRGLPRTEGHKAGTKAAKNMVTFCRELGIPHLTLYTFSRENWNRPKDEVAILFDLLVQYLRSELDTLLNQDIRFHVLGEWPEMPFAVRKIIELVISRTAKCSSMTLNLALNYSGREEILRACRKLMSQGLDPAKLDEGAFANALYTAGQPDPDLIIRTSGELRLSNFLLFQAAYSEFYFTDTHWPDFGRDELNLALEDYAARQRRYGKTGEQIADGNPGAGA